MALSLTHLGEQIFAAMVNANRECLLSLPNLPDMANPEFVRSAPRIAFPEAPLGRFGKRTFDGACRIDVAIHLKREAVTAFELKLGSTRLTATRVNEEWLVPCTTSHGGQRWKGNVMAALERKFSETVADELTANIGDGFVPITKEWFIVARKETVVAWQERRPNFTPFVRVIAFEDVVSGFGGEEPFNELVRRTLDVNFYREWVLGDSNAG